MLTEQQKLRAITSILGEVERITGEEVFFWCPREECKNHHKPKLSVNLKRDCFHCWVCGWGGRSLLPLLRLRGETEHSRAYQDASSPAGSIKAFDKPQLPKDFRTLTKDWASRYCRQAKNYLLRERGLTEDDLYRYRVGYCEDGGYSERVVFPSFDEDGALNYVIGRSIYDRHPVYLSGNYDKGSIVFNEYLVDWSKPVVVVEGIFDAIRVGDNAVPILGSSLGADTRLFQRIVRSKQDVVLMLDFDALSKQLRIARRFLDYDVTVRFVDISGHKDPGSMRREDIIRSMDGAVALREEIDLLPLRMKL